MIDGRKVTRLLLARYPSPKLALEWRTPLELLVAVVLSAQCTDARVNAVTTTLFRKYRRAADYAKADVATFEEEIRPTGFYRNKAKLVIGCCKRLVEAYAGEVPAALEDLTTLPGVGRKTANMVLGNAFGRQAIAVDTHVARVARRLGLTQADDPEVIESDLAKRIPKTHWTAFANATILHGRETCTARRPNCPECVLNLLCEYQDKTA
jgi:endonuclease III